MPALAASGVDGEHFVGVAFGGFKIGVAGGVDDDVGLEVLHHAGDGGRIGDVERGRIGGDHFPVFGFLGAQAAADLAVGSCQ